MIKQCPKKDFYLSRPLKSLAGEDDIIPDEAEIMRVCWVVILLFCDRATRLWACPGMVGQADCLLVCLVLSCAS